MCVSVRSLSNMSTFVCTHIVHIEQMYTFTNANLYQPSLRFADRERQDLTSRRLTM